MVAHLVDTLVAGLDTSLVAVKVASTDETKADTMDTCSVDVTVGKMDAQ